MRNWYKRLPDWAQDWLDIIIPASHILLIVLAGWLLQRSLRWLLFRAAKRYGITQSQVAPILGVTRWLIIASSVLLVLERLGVSATVLWAAFTSFATVAAVAFFAAWSVLSNLFCALLIFTAGPFKVGDYIEVLDTAEKPGAKGRVVDINLLYTTLEEWNPGGEVRWMQVPNSLFFQRVVRRWHGEPQLSTAPLQATPMAPEAQTTLANTPPPGPETAPSVR